MPIQRLIYPSLLPLYPDPFSGKRVLTPFSDGHYRLAVEPELLDRLEDVGERLVLALLREGLEIGLPAPHQLLQRRDIQIAVVEVGLQARQPAREEAPVLADRVAAHGRGVGRHERAQELEEAGGKLGGAGFNLSGEGYEVSFLYHAETIHDKIATIDVSNSPASSNLDSSRSFVIFNAADLQSRGMAIEVTRQINPVLTAVASYRLSFAVPVYIIEKIHHSNRRLYFKEGERLEDYHNLQAGISATISRTQTRVEADWRFSSSTPFVFGSPNESMTLSTFDVEVQQGIPVQVFAQTELQVMVAVRNLFDQSADQEGNADFQRALLYGMPRVVAGGLLLKF